MYTNEVGKGKGEVLEARQDSKIKHLLQKFSRNTHNRMERSTLMGWDTGPWSNCEEAARKGHIHMADTSRRDETSGADFHEAHSRMRMRDPGHLALNWHVD